MSCKCREHIHSFTQCQIHDIEAYTHTNRRLHGHTNALMGTHTDAACVGPEPKMIYDPTKKLI